MKNRIWVVSANGSRATVFRADSAAGPLTLVEHLEHPEGRLRRADLLSDRAGRSFDRQGDARHALSREVDPKEQEHIRFAEEIAAYLEHGRTAQEYQRLVLVAAPALLGLLRAELSAPLRTLVAFELDKDLTTLDAVQLRARLPRTI